MVDVAALVLEVVRLLLVAAIAGTLFVLGRRHDLKDADGWRWIQVGLVFFIVESGFDVLNEFLVDRPLVAGVGLETLAEEPLLVVGFACLAYGLVRWLPLPAKLRQASAELESANERLEARVEERTRQLEHVNERLAQLLDHTPAIIYTCEAEPPHELRWLCENTRHVIDVTADQLQAEADTWLAHVHPDDRDAVEAGLAELAQGPNGGKLSHEYRFVVDGQTRWLHETMRTMPKGEGEAPELIASAVDVTERVEAEAELAESERRLSEITENMDATVWLATLEGDPADSEVLYLGPGAEEMFGLPEDVLRANPMAFVERVPEAHVDEVLAAMVPDGDGERGFEVEYPIQLDDGRIKHLRTRGVPIHDEDGEPYRIAGVTEDVTERVEAQRELAEQTRLYENLLTSQAAMGQAVAVFDLENWEIVFANYAFFTLLHRSRETVEALDDPTELILPEHRDRVRAEMAGFLEGEIVQRTEFPITTPRGEVRWLEASGTLMEETSTARIVVVAQDITEEKRNRRELEERDKQFRQIAESLDVDVWLADWDDEDAGELLYATSTFEEIHEIPLERLYEDSMAWLEPVHPADRERVDQALEAMDPENPEFDLEYRLLMDDGRVKHVTSRGFPVIEDGEVVRLVGISQDVTEQVEARREREALAHRLQVVVENQDIVVFSVDAEGYITLSEGRGLQALGVEPGAGVGQHVSDLGDEGVVGLIEAAREGEEQREILQLGSVHFDVQLMPRVEDEAPFAVTGVALDVTEQVEARRHLDRERHRYGQMLKAVPRCIVHIDSEGRFTYANDRAEEVLGLDPSQVSGRAYNDPDWQIRDLDGNEIPDEELPFRRVLDTGEVVDDARHTIRWPDGTERVLSVHGAPIFDGMGEVESTVFALADVTERLEREREVKRERDLRAALFEANTDAIVHFGFDEEGYTVIRDVNDSFEEVFGYEGEEIVGRRVADVFVPEESLEEHAAFNRRLLAGEPVGTEVERVTVDGLRKFHLQAIPVQLEGAEPGGYAWFTDLTTLRKLEEEEAFKAEMLDQVGQAVIATDAEGTVTYWNKHAEAMYGYDAEEAIGESILELTVPDTPEGRRQAEEILEAVEAGEEWSGEYTARHKDGSTFPALVSDSPVFDHEGELVGIIGVSRDITELKETQHKLAELTNRLRARNRELRDLSQAAAHGFRTPIWDTVRYLGLLEQEAGDKLDPEERAHLETAQDGARRLHALVERLQDYLDVTTREPGIGPTHAGDVLEDVLASLADEIKARGADVSVETPAPELAVDEASLADTFRHLLENAIKFSGDEPPEIDVGFEREDEMWVISVSDTGCGIEPEYRERIFRPFRTLHGPQEGGGVGLGLALCRGFVEVHGGAIWVTSTPGEGTTVNMTLPAAGHGIPEAVLGQHPEAEGFHDDIDLFE